MVPLLKALLWDAAAGRAVVMAVGTAATIFWAQPAGRPLEERLIGAALGAVFGGAASAPSGRSKEAQSELDALRVRIDVLDPPAPR